MTIVAERTFVPPGPGSWFLDPTHWTRPVTRFHAEIFPDAFKRGFEREPPSLRIVARIPGGGLCQWLPYYCARPVGAPREAVGHPRRRCGRSSRALTPRSGAASRRAQRCSSASFGAKTSQRWDLEVKPAAIRAHLALLKIDPDTLDTTGLLEYLDRCRENQIQGAYIHHFFNVPALRAGRRLSRVRARVDRPLAGPATRVAPRSESGPARRR